MFTLLEPIRGEDTSVNGVYLGGSDFDNAHLVAFLYSYKTDTATVQSIDLQTKKATTLVRGIASLFAHPSPFAALVGVSTTGEDGTTTFYDTKTGKPQQIVPVASTVGKSWSWFGRTTVAVENAASNGFSLYGTADEKKRRRDCASGR